MNNTIYPITYTLPKLNLSFTMKRPDDEDFDVAAFYHYKTKSGKVGCETILWGLDKENGGFAASFDEPSAEGNITEMFSVGTGVETLKELEQLIIDSFESRGESETPTA